VKKIRANPGKYRVPLRGHQIRLQRFSFSKLAYTQNTEPDNPAFCVHSLHDCIMVRPLLITRHIRKADF